MENSNPNNNVQTTTILSEEAKHKLLELQAQLQEQINRSDISDYIKFKDGDQKILKFEAERTREALVSYEENKDPVQQYKFYASELVNEQQSTWTQVKEWTISPKWANLVIQLLVKGFLTLEVIRKGSGMNTNYSITPYLK
jgi:hypothetical protein